MIPTASLVQIKKELKFLSEEDLFNLVIRLAKLKKDNKELLSYLLFEADNEHQYVEGVKKQLDEEFDSLNPGVYYAKKSQPKA